MGQILSGNSMLEWWKQLRDFGSRNEMKERRLKV